MLVSLSCMRAGARRFTFGTPLLLLAACSGGDLLLPEDRTPALLRYVSGDGQTAVAGDTVPNPLVVQALDRAERPVEGAVIVFEFVDPPSGAAIAPPVSETDTSGRAAAEVVLGRPAGDQPVVARLDDPERELSVTFLLTAIPSNTGGGGDDDDDDPPPPAPPPPPPGDGGGDDDDDGGGGNGGGGGGGGGGDDDDNSGEGGGGGDDEDEGDDDEDDDEGNRGKGGKGKGGGNSGEGGGDD